MHYKLKYRQPYEYDEDSSDGIGDHDVAFQTNEAVFDAPNDKDAREQVATFLALGGVLFTHHLDGDHLVHHRQFVSLTGERTVTFKSKQPAKSRPTQYQCMKKDCPTWGCQHRHMHTAYGEHGMNWCTSTDRKPNKDCPVCTVVQKQVPVIERS